MRLEPTDLCEDWLPSYRVTLHLVEPSRFMSHTKFRGPARVRIRANIDSTFFPCSTNARQSCTNESIISAETAPNAITRFIAIPVATRLSSKLSERSHHESVRERSDTRSSCRSGPRKISTRPPHLPPDFGRHVVKDVNRQIEIHNCVHF
jgi:hypothetical protein